MIRLILFVSFVGVIAATISSCVKDRIQPMVIVTPPVDTTGTDTTAATLQLVDYWSFNTNDTSTLLIPNLSLNGASISYVSSYFDDVNPGTAINIRNSDTAGDGLRMRNPFTSITFLLPTTGYTNPVFTFAAQRSSSGPTVNNVYYTIDGTNFINDNLSMASLSIDTAWSIHSISFAGIKGVNNNPAFAIRLVTGDNNTGSSGNDRYDNVSFEAYKP